MLSFVPFVVALNIPANLTVLAYKFKKSYSSIMLAGSVLNISLNLLLAPFFSAEGTAVSVIITEVFITSGLYVILRMNHNVKLIV